MTRFPALLFLAAALAIAPAHAMRVYEVELTCPIGGGKFTTRMVVSGTAFGQYLDRRQFGATVSPWPLAKCPANGFVIFRKDFTPAEVTRLTAIVASPEYRALQARETNHYLAAYLERRLGAAPYRVFSLLLAATWEASGEERYDRYATEALATLEQVMTKPDATFEDPLGHAQLAAELERRLGRFDAAHRRLSALLPDVRGSELERLVTQELRLVEARDRSPQQVEPAPAAKPRRSGSK